jgi:hypothetical protein
LVNLLPERGFKPPTFGSASRHATNSAMTAFHFCIVFNNKFNKHPPKKYVPNIHLQSMHIDFNYTSFIKMLLGLNIVCSMVIFEDVREKKDFVWAINIYLQKQSLNLFYIAQTVKG